MTSAMKDQELDKRSDIEGEVMTQNDFEQVLKLRGGANEHEKLRCITKNVQSLQTPDRERELFAELRVITWDVLFLNETWRESKEEIWKSEDGHLFMGAGGTIGERGVAIILNHRLTKGFKAFHAVSERVCAVDVSVFGCKLRLISAYMPHQGYNDDAVENTYSVLTDLCESGKRLNRSIWAFGDWNAVAGLRQSGEDNRIIGSHGIGQRNQRGDSMIAWATLNGLSIVNTMFRKQFGKLWTHDNGLNLRQIDYGMIQRSRQYSVLDAEACNNVNVGADHRSVRVDISIEVGMRSKKASMERRSPHGWEPRDADEYQNKLNVELDFLLTRWGMYETHARIEDKCKDIERVLINVAGQCEKVENQAKDERAQLSTRLNHLIEERRTAREFRHKDKIKKVSKDIQKELRAVTKAKHRGKISKILEQFRGLKDIADIRNDRKNRVIASMKDANGQVHNTREGIADVFADFYADLFKKLMASRG